MDDDAWRAASSHLAVHMLDQARLDIGDAFSAASKSLQDEHALSATDVRTIWRTLNEARWQFEECIVPLADNGEPWGDPVPNVPMTVLRDHCSDGDGD